MTYSSRSKYKSSGIRWDEELARQPSAQENEKVHFWRKASHLDLGSVLQAKRSANTKNIAVSRI